jgi:hypothetical protein
LGGLLAAVGLWGHGVILICQASKNISGIHNAIAIANTTAIATAIATAKNYSQITIKHSADG